MTNLKWQSKLVLLLVLPAVAADAVLEARWWAVNDAPAATWAVGLSLLLGLVVLKLRAATPAGAFTGAAITASLIFSTLLLPESVPWHTAVVPVLTVSFLAHLATRFGRKRKEQLGTAEPRQGRSAAQIAANLGVAALVSNEVVQSALIDSHRFSPGGFAQMPIYAPMLAALAEAAADTVSSEIGLVLGGKPRLLTTLRQVEAGTDGAISVAGTVAGIIAAAVVAGVGSFALRGDIQLFWISGAAGIFGLLFDSLLGATAERRGWLNNDAVNFLSTASAAAFALLLLALVPHPGAS